MSPVLRSAAAIAVAGLWINGSEFLRNQVLLAHRWNDHYRSMGLTFPSAPINGAFWMLWGFAAAAAIFSQTRRFGWVGAATLLWAVLFPMMWIVLGNLAVLPSGLVPWAIPLSLLEVFGAAWICRRLAPPR